MTQIFKKEDFLTAHQIAKQFGYDPALVAKEMKILYLKQTKIDIKFGPKNTHPTKRDIISERMGKHRVARIHPLGIDILIAILEQQKGK